MNKKQLVINSIDFIRSLKFRNGGRFLINKTSANPVWLQPGFIKQIYTGIGLSTDTPFQQLKGSMLSYYELEVTDEMLAAGNGTYKVEGPVTKREIVFTTSGKKQIDFQLENMSEALTKAIFSIGVVADTSWASTVQSVPQAQTTQQPVPEPAVVEDHDAIEEEENVLEDEAPGE